MKSTLSICLLVLLTIVGCANRPDKINASYIPHEKHENLNCEGLITQLLEAKKQLLEFSDKQDIKANVDTGILLVTLIPVSVLSGDYESEVSRWKGEVEAVETAQMKKCYKS